MKFFDYFYRQEFAISGGWPRDWDIFVSAWDQSERVESVYSTVTARAKVWIIHPEYNLPETSRPIGSLFDAQGGEARSMQSLVVHLEQLGDLRKVRLCIDITGMLRPHIAVLLKVLQHRGVAQFDAVYSQPKTYAHGEQTRFSSGEVTDVREVTGYEGINRPGAHEVLIVAPGFEASLSREVFSHKPRASRFQIFGLPSLQADMYQQNILQAYGIDTPLPDDETSNMRRFVSAADPFAMATELSAIVSAVTAKQARSRLYIAPLATKAQMLGAALYCLTECRNVAASLIYPVVSAHIPATSSGISNVSINTIDFRLMNALAGS
jgi:hypothetical protein